MCRNLDENTIKLHTAPDGVVWYSKTIGPPKSSGAKIIDFLLTPIFSGYGHAVRLLGTGSNAALIAALHVRRHKNEIRAVEVAGPNAIAANLDTDSPEVILMQMRAITAPVACGGWHTVSFHDAPTYAMLAKMQQVDFAVTGVVADVLDRYLRIHPVYRASMFVPHLDPAALARLLTTIIDPRWYVDQRMPERTAKLELFMVLTPRTQTRVSDKSCVLVKKREFRCAAVLGTWKTREPEDVDLSDPQEFLYRVRAKAGGGAKGDLRASQVFLRYLRYNWLATLEQRTGIKDGLFAPDLFFKLPDEVATYKTHIKSFV